MLPRLGGIVVDPIYLYHHMGLGRCGHQCHFVCFPLVGLTFCHIGMACVALLFTIG
jgi:hypothetical protein